MRIRWMSAAIIALLIAGGIGWYLESPVWTLKQMASAAQHHDADKLSAYVDYPKLRETTKAQLEAVGAAKIASGSGSGWEAVGMMVGLTMVDKVIDGAVTPDGITAIFAAQRSGADAAVQSAKKPFGIDATKAEIVHDGLDRFRLHQKGKTGEDGDLIFERHGLGWKLAEIRVPANLFQPKQ